MPSPAALRQAVVGVTSDIAAFSERSSYCETADQLQPRLGKFVEAALVGSDGSNDVSEAACWRRAAVYVRQQLAVIGGGRAKRR
jgi:hypothetical protein